MKSTKLTILVTLFALCNLLSACGEKTEYFATYTPTATTPSTSTPTPTRVTPTPTSQYPLVSEWVVGEELEEWQKPAFNEVVKTLWDALYAPPGSDLPDCQKATSLYSDEVAFRKETIVSFCSIFEEQGFFIKTPTLNELKVTYFSFPEEQIIVVRLDTESEWQAAAYYWADGAYYGHEDAPRPKTYWDVYLKINIDTIQVHYVDQVEYSD